MCGGCVKKMQGVLAKVPGIARVEGNAAEKTMTIVPASNTTLSPKAIWEAIEAAGKKPAKLVGPAGEFATKPKS
ncbi:MAG: cation transporter [Planctomycetaceae bacterium]|nr:cation transporter [Planctomycetaceae bacterium]